LREWGGRKRVSPRIGRGGVDDDGNKWDGSESERERELGVFERRGVVYRLGIVKRMHDE